MRVKETRPPSFLGYWKLFFTYTLLFSPVVLLSFFREWLKSHLNQNLFRGLWIFCFVVYPIMLSLFPVEESLNIPWMGYFVPVVGSGLLLTEIAIQANIYVQKNDLGNLWLQRFSLDRILLVLLVLLSFFIIIINSTYQDEYGGLGSLFIFSGQFFLMLLLYYLYFYINNKILIPKILKPAGVIPYGFAFVGVILLLYPIVGKIMVTLPFLEQLELPFFGNKNVFYEDNHIIIPLTIMLLSIPFILVFEWSKSNNRIASLEKEKSETELSLLKQQINPHFFFNTLNNLYALSLTKDQQTPEVILQLSELMRYVIYKGKEDWVSLEEEVKYIEDYIQLQQIRLHKKMDFRFEKNVKDKTVNIPPLLFITFVENAFKHGIEPAENPCFLHLFLKSDNAQLTFVCENSFEEIQQKEDGIGLKNLRRRLDLRFDGKHNLEIVENKEVFRATMDIPLK